MNYPEALAFFYSFSDWERGVGFNKTATGFGLEKTNSMLNYMGNPEKDLFLIHVAGSKGKGSTCHMLAEALHRSGYKTGLFTQPHLHTFRERIQIGLNPISELNFTNLAKKTKSTLTECARQSQKTFVPTTYELTTVAAFKHFSEMNVDVAIIEVGLGGRLDATNVITPKLSVITPIELEHTSILGTHIEQIAYEKAGIIKPFTPVITAPQLDKAMTSIQDIAAQLNAPIDLVTNSDISYWSKDVIGMHNRINAAVVTKALDILVDVDQGLTVPHKTLMSTVRSFSLPARCEIVTNDPLLIIDSAHTVNSINHTIATADELRPNKPLTLIFGCSYDKEVDRILNSIAGKVASIIACKSHHSKAMDPDRIYNLAQRHGIPCVIEKKVEQALKIATSHKGESTGVVVTGSMYLAAEAREALRLHDDTDPHTVSFPEVMPDE
tara:strand:- start:345 stop:1661 length:1317 start_codon:yes stop_codon:yes gene_type:complete